MIFKFNSYQYLFRLNTKGSLVICGDLGIQKVILNIFRLEKTRNEQCIEVFYICITTPIGLLIWA